MSYYITLDAQGNEVGREPKGRGRPRSNFVSREDGNFYFVPGGMIAPMKQKEEVVEPVPVVVNEQRSGGMILTPAGRCPVRLLGTGENSVLDWRRALKEFDPRFSNEAVQYFVREFYPVGSVEHGAAIGWLTA